MICGYTLQSSEKAWDLKILSLWQLCFFVCLFGDESALQTNKVNENKR